MSPRRSLAMVACVMFSYITCLGQNPVSFGQVTSSGGQFGSEVYAVDVNNDGVTDLVQDTLSAPIGFTVSVAKGDGTFEAPVRYSLPSGLVAPAPMGFADFNGDGKVDIVVPNVMTNEILIYLGNGNGTFQSPKISRINFPSGYSFNNYPVVTADFNHDGKIDVVAADYNFSGSINTNGLVVLQGDGSGGLIYRNQIFTGPGQSLASVVGGDFDADNNADVAVVTNQLCDGGAVTCNSVLHVLYGNGAFGFTETTPFSSGGGFSVASGDLNGDGTTDLFGYDGQAVLLYGQPDRKFTQYYVQASIAPTLMADFNGDGRMDLVGGAPGQLQFLLAGTTPGDFRTQTYQLSSSTLATTVALGDFNGDKRPDLAYATLASQSSNGASEITALLNQVSGYFGACAFPRAGQGINLCHPANATSTTGVIFNATANSFGDIRKFELWVDGKKLTEQHHSWGHKAYLDFYTPLAVGSHYVTLNVTTIDNDAMDYNETLHVTQ